MLNFKSLDKQEDPYQTLESLIKKYKGKIPQIYTGDVIFNKNCIPHSHPKITLNYRWEKSPNPESTLLMLYVHEQLHWYEEKILTRDLMNILKQKYKIFLNNKKCLYEFPNENNFIIHIVVLTNELNIAKKILTSGEYKAVYHEEYWQPYTNTRNYIEGHLNDFVTYLKQQNLIWSN